MASIIDSPKPTKHILLFPSAGMGHLLPFLRLTAMVASHNDCTVTLITVHPTVSNAESNQLTTFFKTHPHINRLVFNLPPDKPSSSTTYDPFFAQFEAINRSVHLLHPLLSSLQPSISAIFADFAVASGISQVADSLSLPFYIVSTTSARFFALLAYLPYLTLENTSTGDDKSVNIPGLEPITISTIPPPFFDPNNRFASFTSFNARFLAKAKGILMNTFNKFDHEAIDALDNGRVISNLPPVIPIGPFKPLKDEEIDHFSWLDHQPES